MHNSLPRTSAINASLPSQSSFAVDKPMRKDEKRRSWETLLIWTLPTSGPSSIVRELCGPCWSDWSCHGKATLQLPYSHSLETDALSASVWKSLHPLPPLRAAVIAAAGAGASARAEALPAAAAVGAAFAAAAAAIAAATATSQREPSPTAVSLSDLL